jgi:hypothetical protein
VIVEHRDVGPRCDPRPVSDTQRDVLIVVEYRDFHCLRSGHLPDTAVALSTPDGFPARRDEFGIFDQEIHDGWQVEQTDNCLDNGNPWKIAKPDVNYLVKWGGYTEHHTDPGVDAGPDRVQWVPGRLLKGVAYDTPVQGYGVNTCTC